MITLAGWWVFMALAPVAYWLAPPRWRGWLLALASLAMLAYYAPRDLPIMLALAGLAYGAFALEGPWLAQWRSTALVLLVVGYLAWSKYLPAFAIALAGGGDVLALAIPLGVSYFCFKLIHYVIERGRGNFAPHALSDFASYMFLAPIFSAGPIERFEHFVGQREGRFSAAMVVEGLTRILQGIVKKFLICVLLAEAIQRVTGGDVLSLLGGLAEASPLHVWAFLALSLAYVYFDFSAYTDIAVGASRMFGLRIMENFNYPFLATSLRDFWLRWHMTLAIWCRTYIYMSMIGLTRNPYAAVIATFAVMGLWHAGWPLHWLAWGLWHGVGSVVVLVWARFAQKNKVQWFKTKAGSFAGWAMTMAFVALGGAFTALYGKAPLGESLRLIAKAFALSI